MNVASKHAKEIEAQRRDRPILKLLTPAEAAAAAAAWGSLRKKITFKETRFQTFTSRLCQMIAF
jgi:hypothetical protein